MKLEETNKKEYNILLGGSTIAGKTTYSNSYFEKRFYEVGHATQTFCFRRIKELNKTKFLLFDSPHWDENKIFDRFIKTYIKNADGIILMFDLSKEEDFYKLPNFLNMITEFHELEDFPVLLIGNKSDLFIEVYEDKIEEFVERENLIGYFEVSCKTNKNVEESIDFIVDYINKKEKKKFA